MTVNFTSNNKTIKPVPEDIIEVGEQDFSECDWNHPDMHATYWWTAHHYMRANCKRTLDILRSSPEEAEERRKQSKEGFDKLHKFVEEERMDGERRRAADKQQQENEEQQRWEERERRSEQIRLENIALFEAHAKWQNDQQTEREKDSAKAQERLDAWRTHVRELQQTSDAHEAAYRIEQEIAQTRVRERIIGQWAFQVGNATQHENLKYVIQQLKSLGGPDNLPHQRSQHSWDSSPSVKLQEELRWRHAQQVWLDEQQAEPPVEISANANTTASTPTRGEHHIRPPQQIGNEQGRNMMSSLFRQVPSHIRGAYQYFHSFFTPSEGTHPNAGIAPSDTDADGLRRHHGLSPPLHCLRWIWECLSAGCAKIRDWMLYFWSAIMAYLPNLTR